MATTTTPQSHPASTASCPWSCASRGAARAGWDRSSSRRSSPTTEPMKRPHDCTPASARAGFTLIEAVIAAALLILLLSSAILAAKGGQGAFRATQDANDVETRLRRALDRVALELLSVGEEELLPNPTGQFGASDLLYRQARSWDGNAGDGVNGLNILWGPQNRLAFEYEAEETNDGTDEDGDGLVDEGRIVLTRDVGGNE